MTLFWNLTDKSLFLKKVGAASCDLAAVWLIFSSSNTQRFNVADLATIRQNSVALLFYNLDIPNQTCSFQ
jgi:hypothetical protein